MNNILLWIILLLVNFTGITLSYKLFKKTGLYIWIAMAAIIANIQVMKTIEVAGFVTTLGNIIYGTSYLATDILNEKYGRKAAQKGVYIGIFILLVTTVIMQVCLLFTPHASDIAQDSFKTIFGLLPRIAFASVVAYSISQIHDVWLFDKLRKRKNSPLWLRNNLSTLISQFIDNVLFTIIAFLGIFPMEIIIEIFVTTYIMKFVVAALDTPFIYLARKLHVEEK